MKQLEQKIYRYLKARGWHQLRPADIAKSIVIEASELLENFQWENESLQEVKKDKSKHQAIQSELADIFIYAIEMSVLLGFDTEKIIRKKLAYVEKKYPAGLMKKTGNKDQAAGDEYWKIKKAYRKKALG